MTKEQQLAQVLCATAKVNSVHGCTGDGYSFNFDAVIVDRAFTFDNGKHNLVAFAKACDLLGYDVFPLEISLLAMFDKIMTDKLVVQNKEYREVCDIGGKL